MAYSYTEDFAEAERRLGEAMHIPGWPISTKYASLINGEHRASLIRIIGIDLTGPLRTEPLLRATNVKRGAGLPIIGEGQVGLVCARGNVLDLRLRSRRVEVGVVFGRHALAEVERECPEAMDEQRERVQQAVRGGWQLSVVDEGLLLAEARKLHPEFVCSLSFDGVPGQRPATYLQIDRTTGHEHWIDDPEIAQKHRDAYERLAGMAVSLQQAGI